MKKLLILGASGLIGKAIIDECKDVFEVYGTYHSNKTGLPSDKQFQIGLREYGKLQETISLIQPDIVISCISGEFDQQLEFHKQLASELENTASRLYYLSTANVFDGDFSRHHTEDDTPVAESDYGSFKIKCENTLKQILGDRTIVIRIPAIWGKESPRMDLIKNGIEKSETIHAYGNLECNNLLDTQLARQLHFIIDNDLRGIFHLGSMDMMTQENFFEALIEALSGKSAILKSKPFNESESLFYFGLCSNRNEIPSSLRATNDNIVAHLIG